MDRQEFSKLFEVGEQVKTGGNRTYFKIEEIEEDRVTIRPTESKGKASHHLSYEKIAAVTEVFSRIDPKHISPTFHNALSGWGLKDHTNETYLYGLVRELIRRSGGLEEPLPEEIPPGTAETLLEGAKKVIVVNTYERDPTAKSKCLRHWGCSCVVCDFNFGNRYGGYGEGFIHVHHLKPLAEIGSQYKLDPVRDLRPVCPNCHAMLHHSSPVLSIEELQAMVR